MAEGRQHAPDDADGREEVQALFAAIKASLPKLEDLLERCSDHWGYEDLIYRFYHRSFKVYALQGTTLAIVETLQELAPDLPLNDQFIAIVRDGTGRTFQPDHNRRWMEVTRPILEAFFHARYFLEMVVRYGRSLSHPPQSLPSGWASVLYLYKRR